MIENKNINYKKCNKILKLVRNQKILIFYVGDYNGKQGFDKELKLFDLQRSLYGGLNGKVAQVQIIFH